LSEDRRRRARCDIRQWLRRKNGKALSGAINARLRANGLSSYSSRRYLPLPTSRLWRAAGSLLPPGWSNATGDATSTFRAAGARVVGCQCKLLTVCAGDVCAMSDDNEDSLCATLLGTARDIDTTRNA
jgi:hypothetical protein